MIEDLNLLIGPSVPPPQRDRYEEDVTDVWFRLPVTQRKFLWFLMTLFTETNIFINTSLQSNKNVHVKLRHHQTQWECHWDACCLAAMTFGPVMLVSDYLNKTCDVGIGGTGGASEGHCDMCFTYSNLSSKLLHISFYFSLNISNCGAVVSEKLLLGNIFAVDRQSSTEMIDFSSIFNWKLIICVEQWSTHTHTYTQTTDKPLTFLLQLVLFVLPSNVAFIPHYTFTLLPFKRTKAAEGTSFQELSSWSPGAVCAYCTV